MIGPVILFGVIIVVLLIVVLAWSKTRGFVPSMTRSAVSRETSAAVRVARRRVVIWRWAGVLAGVLAAVVSAQSDGLGRGLMLAPAFFAITVVFGVLAGELSVRPLAATRRTATLGPRRMRDYLPRRLLVTVAVTCAALLLLLTATTLTGSSDDLGRAGRSLAVAADDELRTCAASSVVASCGVLCAAPLAGVAAVSVMVTINNPCKTGWWWVMEVTLGVAVCGALVVLGWCLSTLLVPTPTGRQAPFSSDALASDRRPRP